MPSATYEELAALPADSGFDAFRDKVTVAMLVQARVIEQEDVGTTSHAARLALAKAIYADPQAYRDRFVRAMIAANATATVAQILGAEDSQVLSAVAGAWNTFIEVS